MNHSKNALNPGRLNVKAEKWLEMTLMSMGALVLLDTPGVNLLENALGPGKLNVQLQKQDMIKMSMDVFQVQGMFGVNHSKNALNPGKLSAHYLILSSF